MESESDVDVVEISTSLDLAMRSFRDTPDDDAWPKTAFASCSTFALEKKVLKWEK